MATRIRYLAIEDVTPGMVLGAPLCSGEQGVTTLTLPAGHVLTDSNIAQIRQRNAEWACVVEEDARSDDERATDLQAAREQLDGLFETADRSQPAIAALYSAVLRYRTM
jgi:hypothetical protein